MLKCNETMVYVYQSFPVLCTYFVLLLSTSTSKLGSFFCYCNTFCSMLFRFFFPLFAPVFFFSIPSPFYSIFYFFPSFFLIFLGLPSSFLLLVSSVSPFLYSSFQTIKLRSFVHIFQADVVNIRLFLIWST